MSSSRKVTCPGRHSQMVSSAWTVWGHLFTLSTNYFEYPPCSKHCDTRDAGEETDIMHARQGLTSLSSRMTGRWLSVLRVLRDT